MPSTQPSYARRRLRTHLLVVAGYAAAAAVAVVLFLAWRVYVYHQTYVSRPSFWLGDFHRHDDDVGFVMAPRRSGLTVLRGGIEDPSRRWPVRTNELGFRIPHDRSESAPRPGSLSSIGCSCTFGYGVPAESTWVYLASRQLNVPANNLGVCSYSAVTSIELLRKHIGTLRPAVVVYGFGNFHLDRSMRPRTDGVLFQSYIKESDEGGVQLVRPHLDNRAAFDVVPRVEELYYRPKLEQQQTRFDLRKLAALLPLAAEDLRRLGEPDFLRLRFETQTLSEAGFSDWVVREIVALCRGADARAVILFFPAFYGETPMPAMLEAVAAYTDSDDVLFLDTSARLFDGVANQQDYTTRWQVPRDGHPNAAMHLEMARVLVEALRDRSWY